MESNGPDPRYRELTHEVLASISADEIASAVVQHVELRIADAGEDQREGVTRSLPTGTRAVYATWLVDVDVNNGGFHQFFVNPYGSLAGLALSGYELLGAEDYAAVMRAAIATYEVERVAVRTAYQEIDQRYYALGDTIYDVWAGFAHRRPELFSES